MGLLLLYLVDMICDIRYKVARHLAVLFLLFEIRFFVCFGWIRNYESGALLGDVKVSFVSFDFFSFPISKKN